MSRFQPSVSFCVLMMTLLWVLHAVALDRLKSQQSNTPDFDDLMVRLTFWAAVVSGWFFARALTKTQNEVRGGLVLRLEKIPPVPSHLAGGRFVGIGIDYFHRPTAQIYVQVFKDTTLDVGTTLSIPWRVTQWDTEDTGCTMFMIVEHADGNRSILNLPSELVESCFKLMPNS